jgi:hypothetical protein
LRKTSETANSCGSWLQGRFARRLVLDGHREEDIYVRHGEGDKDGKIEKNEIDTAKWFLRINA